MNEKNCPLCHTSIPEHAPGGLCPACVLRGADEPELDLSNGPTIEEVAAAFPKLEILRLIGHGGMGYVYQAHQPDLDRMVALKILSPVLRRDPAFEERFAREARVLGKLKHPNIVTLYEHGESGGYFYLMMEFIDGVNLRQAMSAGRFSPERALAIVPAICDALQSAHAQGVWHRDIKPENILLDKDGRVKIADFGIARILGDPERNFTLTRTGGQLGSVAYMAPEQHEKPHSVDHRADIYSLGVVIYEMLTGELPLGRFPAPSQRAEVNARIDEIVLRTLEKERELRQQSAGEVKTEVENVASDFSRSVVLDRAGLKSGTAFQTPRFSGTAIAGACWTMAFLILAASWSVDAGVSHMIGNDHRRPWAKLLSLIPLILGATAIPGSTILGWIAVSQIRRSAGKLHGLWLAVFDGLLFPLLAVDLLVVGLPWTAFKHGLIPVMGGSGEKTAVLILVSSFAVAVVLDWLIIRRVWRAVNRGVNLQEPSEQDSSKDASPGATTSHGKLAFGFFVAGFLGIPLILGVLFRNEDAAIPFSLLSLLLAFILGVMSWRDHLGRFVVIATSVLFGVVVPLVAISFRMTEQEALRREKEQRANAQQRQEEMRALQKTRDAAAKNKSKPIEISVADAPVFTLRWVSKEGDVESVILPDGTKPRVTYGDGRVEEEYINVSKTWLLEPTMIRTAGWTNRRGEEKTLFLILKNEADMLVLQTATQARIGDRIAVVWRNRVIGVLPVNSPLSNGIHIPMIMEDVEADTLDKELNALSKEQAAAPRNAGDAMRLILTAARERNARAFQNGFSRSFMDSLREHGESPDNFGDFAKCKFIEAFPLDALNAEVVIEADDGSKRRFTFPMILEDAEWKLNGAGTKR